jgi:hypothetical protein
MLARILGSGPNPTKSTPIRRNSSRPTQGIFPGVAYLWVLMATPIELGLLLFVALAVITVYVLLKIVKPLIVNAVVGLIVLLAASLLGFGVNITWVAVLIVALGGLPGAILVLLLGHLGIMFQPAMVLPLVALA